MSNATQNLINNYEIIPMLIILIDNVFVQFGRLLFQQTISIPRGTTTR
jgi:hypothetical protein